MSSSTGRILVRQIKQIELFRREPTGNLVEEVQSYMPRAEAVVTGKTHNSSYAHERTKRNWLFMMGFLEYANQGKESE